MGQRVVWTYLQGSFVLRDGFPEFALVHQGQSERGMGRGIVFRYGNRMPKEGDATASAAVGGELRQRTRPAPAQRQWPRPVPAAAIAPAVVEWPS